MKTDSKKLYARLVRGQATLLDNLLIFYVNGIPSTEGQYTIISKTIFLFWNYSENRMSTPKLPILFHFKSCFHIYFMKWLIQIKFITCLYELSFLLCLFQCNYRFLFVITEFETEFQCKNMMRISNFKNGIMRDLNWLKFHYSFYCIKLLCVLTFFNCY